MLSWFKSWKKRRGLQKLARQMGSLLTQRYGFQEYYTPEQVLKTAELSGLDREAQTYAVVMYVLPEKAQGVLRKLGETKLAEQVRAFMTATCFGANGYGDGYFSHYNVFAHHDAVVSHHSINHAGGSFDGSHSHHSSDGGHGGGDSGGGHH